MCVCVIRLLEDYYAELDDDIPEGEEGEGGGEDEEVIDVINVNNPPGG